MNEDADTPEVEMLDWQDLGTQPDYAEIDVDDAPDFAAPEAAEKTVPYPMTRRVLEGSEKSLVVEFDLPGVRASEIAVTIDGDRVEVKAVRPGQDAADAAAFTIADYDLDRTTAWAEDGVLRVRIPRAPYLRREVFVKTR